MCLQIGLVESSSQEKHLIFADLTSLSHSHDVPSLPTVFILAYVRERGGGRRTKKSYSDNAIVGARQTCIYT